LPSGEKPFADWLPSKDREGAPMNRENFVRRIMTTADTKAATKESESLIVEFSKEPVIVLDPDSNCFYVKVR
jgi:hypothetical protein